MIRTKHTSRAGGILPLARRAIPLAAAFALSACSIDSILEVDDPDVATPATLGDSTALPVLNAGALGEFAQAYGGSGNTNGGSDNEGQILLSGLLGDEFTSFDTFDTRIEIDRRDITVEGGTSTNGQLQDAERNLQRARTAAENLAAQYAQFGQGKNTLRARAFALAGYTYIFFGENYCEGVAFSSIPFSGGTPTFGQPTTRDQVFQLAVARFDSALAITPTSNLARVGKARALLNLGQFAQAAAVAADVPATYSFLVPYSENTQREENGVYQYAQANGRYGVSDREGGNGLPYRTIGIDLEGGKGNNGEDPRVLWRSGGDPFDTSLGSGIYPAQAKYDDRGADIPLATGVEAQLIVAEAALNKGASDAYLPIVNKLRDAEDLEPLEDPGTAAGRVNQFFAERAYFLWLTSHRLGDMRRLVRQYGRAANTVFPTGTTIRGETYGNDVNLPLYFDETNNPNSKGCTNRNA